MMTQVSEAILNDPVVLALSVLTERIRALSREDRDDVLELTELLFAAETDEDRQAAAAGLQEILLQRDRGIRSVSPVGACDEVQKWADYAGRRIREERERAGLTQDQLAEKAGLPQSHISRLENGRHSPSSLTVEKIAAALSIQPKDLDPSL